MKPRTPEQRDFRKAIDGNLQTRYTTGRYMEPGMWLKIDLKSEYEIEKLVLDTRPSPTDYPRGYTISTSKDGQFWSEPIVAGSGIAGLTEINLPKVTTKYVMITQTGTGGPFWSIHELEVYGRPMPK